MPYINVKVAGKLSREQKEEIARQFTDTLEQVAGKPKKSTYIVIEEVDRANWAVGGELLG
ncbi:MAG: 4-oxalocrotonate tautomerase family protein [Candidatus Auribacterota bacterium]|jgi:4-oxalocrotonate tautomerase|nr:4-oxalocrotonate tautomerase family protein [Candidatus Auribacterota bacterium]